MKLKLILIGCFLVSFNLSAQPVRIMLVTGGHSYDTLQFIQMFREFPGIEFEHFNQPEANKALINRAGIEFDVLVFYDMWETISDSAKAAYIELTKLGKPFLFLHHSLVSYQDWPVFEDLVGGRYVQNDKLPLNRQSDYQHDVWVEIEIADKNHPVTRGLSDFKLFDEVYGNFRYKPGVKPLLRTNHSQSTPLIGWENRYNESTIIYLQPGHDKNAFESEPFQRLVFQSIKYLAEPE